MLESPVEVATSPANAEPSPFRDKKWQSHLQKKLFQEQSEFEQFPTQMEEIQPTTQDLKDICSGNFTVNENILEAQSTLDDNEIIEAQGTLDEYEAQTEDRNVKVDDEDENFITQILNEDELEKFKRKFASPAQQNVDSSDGEDEEIVVNKKKRKRLVFSDDDDEEEEEIVEEEEEIGLHDEDDEETEKPVNYDSEENEIEEGVL